MFIFNVGFGIDVIILFFIILVALAIINSKDLMTSTILLAIFSLLMAAEYVVLGAADVAFTEAAVGAGISTILLLLALFLVGDREKKLKGNLIVPMIIIIFVTVGLLYATFDMPVFGNYSAPEQVHIAPYYLENTAVEVGIPSTVTAILASYRGYDTMGETIVIFTAALIVMLLLGRFDKKGDGENG
jgi:multicomponent Na+:H+ antiporter subunit B